MTREEQVQVSRAKNEIAELNKQLDDILKRVLINQEFIAAGDVTLYDQAELHSNAQECRRKIMVLEAKIEQLKNGG